MRRPCLDCGALTPGTRCPTCTRAYDRNRRPSPEARYGADRKARHRDAIDAEPWCHWEGGCPFPITKANPLTADHPIRVADGGDPYQSLVPMCKRHNSGRGSSGISR